MDVEHGDQRPSSPGAGMTGSHIFTAASGFGLRLIPKTAPYRFTLSPTPPAIDVERAVGER